MKKMILAMMIAMLVIPAIGAKAENVEFEIGLVHYTNKSPFTLIGKAAPGTDVTMRGKPVAKIGDDGVFKIDLEVKEGDNVFHFKATKDGQSTTKGILVQMRTTPPNALFLIDGKLTDQASIEVTTQDATEASLVGFAEPDCKIICDGVDYSSNNIKFEAKFKTDSAPSKMTHKMIVVDKYGNERTFIVETTNVHVLTATMKNNSDELIVDGQKKSLGNPVIIDKGFTMVPAKGFVTQVLGCTIIYDSTTKSATIENEDHTAIIHVKSIKYTFDGEIKYASPTTPIIYKNSMYIPPRFITEAFGATMLYDVKTMTMTIKRNIYP